MVSRTSKLEIALALETKPKITASQLKIIDKAETKPISKNILRSFLMAGSPSLDFFIKTGVKRAERIVK